MKGNEQVIILGAGLVGSLLSLYLSKAGFDVQVYEKRPDPRKARKQEGRSINLALSHRGLHALEKVGLSGKARELSIPMKGRLMHDNQGNLTFQPYGKTGQAINSISRGKLNQLLINEAENNQVSFHFERRISDIDLDRSMINFEDDVRLDVASGGLVIGADGAFSMLRQAMQKRDRFSFSQDYLEHGYKELTIPARENGYAMEPNALHIWPRGGFMLIALPNQDKTFTCTLFLRWEGRNSFESLHSDEAVMNFFMEFFPDVIPLIPELAEQFKANPTSSLLSTSCNPWHHNQFMLIGDAAHAIVPFYGQGMNAGFEDCRLFMETAERNQFAWEKVTKEFSTQRKPDADAIRQLALQNFIEMRDKVGDSAFLYRKKVEARIHELFPEDWIPQYSMVTFSDINYGKALHQGRIQYEVMSEYMGRYNDGHIPEIQYEDIVKEFQRRSKMS
jgi:kynurenine 3-monooxygenase